MAKANARNEQEWIIQSIARDVADLAVYVANPKDSPLAADAVTVSFTRKDESGYHYNLNLRLPHQPKPLEIPLDITGPIWDASAYESLALALVSQLSLENKSDSATIDANPLQSLLLPDALSLERENLRISAFLSIHPLSPEAHEQAALVVGVLGFRENSGYLWDARTMLNRAAAHLAMAKALRRHQPLSDSGEVAELLVSILDDTKKESEERIAKLKEKAQAHPELSPWVMAAQLRNRRDWRMLEKPSAASLLERLEYFRAKCESISPDVASRELLKGSREDISDWSRILLQFDFSVGDGHVFTKMGLKSEFQEIGQVFPEIRARKISAETLAKALDKAPSEAVQRDPSGTSKIVPIDDGMWAHFLQRHLCHVAARTDYFLRHKWGVPDYASEFEKDTGQLFSKLTFAPILRILWRMEEQPEPDALRESNTLIKQHPEWFSVVPWGLIAQHGATDPSIPNWFSPGLPAGTAYCYYGRDDFVPSVKHMSRQNLQKLHEIAPWHYGIGLDYVKAMFGEDPTPDQFYTVMGPFLDFQTGAMYRYARTFKDDSAGFIAVHQKIAKIDPEDYVTQFRYYRDHKMDDAAAEALEQAIKNDVDSVEISNVSGWLVNYYFERGNTDRAMKIAEDAAEVYSSSGLITMAKLQERMENLVEAESYYQKNKERYDHAGPLLAFYQRQAKLHPDSEYARKMKETLGSVFPGGVKSVTLADFSEPPKKGVIIRESNALLVKSGLKEGSIIVALDGKRTETFPQYDFVRALTDSLQMEFIVFQDGKYQSIKAEVPGRKFGLNFQTWP